jgi:cytochrome b subunit of formate dehydrogenase
MNQVVRRDLISGAAPVSEAGNASTGIGRGRRLSPPRTDVGTILLHWTTAITFVVSLFTGLRMATFGSVTPGFTQWLSPVLPQGEMWTWHFFAGLGLFFCASAYVLYIFRSGLSPRNALKRLRVLLMPVRPKLRWEAVNVSLHWFVYALITVLTATGVILYLGHGGWWVWVHSVSALVGFAYIFIHVLTHYLYGGWGQLLRLFRPAKLVVTRAVRSYPLLLAGAAGVATIAVGAGIDWTTRDTLVIARVNTAPTLDGVLDDAMWAKARPITIQTQQGANLGGTGGRGARRA